MPLWIPIVMMMLGGKMQSKQVKKAGDRRMAELRLGREKESAIEDVQRKDVLGEAEQYDPTLRQEAMDTKASETEARISDILAQNELTTTGDVGALPEKLLEQRAKSTRDKANTASIMAALSSKVRAPKDTAFDEGQSMADLFAASQGRTSKLGRTAKTANLLADLEGKTDPKTMMMANLIQQLGMTAASGSIMSGLAAPGVAAGAGATMTPVPNYTAPDAFGVGAIR